MVGLDVHKLYQPPGNRFKWLQEFNIRTVIDVGTNRGQFAFMAQPFFPEAVFHCFEPQRDVAEGMWRKVVKRGLEDRFVVHRIALGNFNGTVKMNRAENTTDSSFLNMTDYFRGIYKVPPRPREEEVVVRKLDDMTLGVIYSELLLKIDVEGYEEQVLRGGEKLLEKVKVIYIEVTFQRERYQGQLLFDDLYSILRTRGFSCFGFSQVYYHYHSGAPYYADAVFVKK